jgi:hypothetical protein
MPGRGSSLDSGSFHVWFLGGPMNEPMVCARCGLLLPPNSPICDCGFPVGDASSLDRVRFERQFRNLYIFTNAFTALGLGMISASVMGQLEWKVMAQGLSGVSGAWAFWSLVESEGEKTTSGLRRQLEYGAVTVSVILFALGVMGWEFRLDLLLWLVMPVSYAWRSYQRRRGLRPS